MIVIHLARKPLSEPSVAANVLEHGTGGLDVDGCRIVVSVLDAKAMERVNTPQSSRMKAGGSPIGTFVRSTPTGPLDTTKGRWPANLILEHRKRCRVVGQKRVKPANGSGIAYGRNASAGRIYGGGKGLVSGEKGEEQLTYADENGLETVEDWACADDCPVADLDEQSGSLTSGSGTVKRGSGVDREGNLGSAYGQESRPAGTPMIWYGDTGGASRFFKQVEPDQEFERSHHLAICPECGETFIDHPTDGRMPFLNVLCDGRRVKL